MSSAKQNKILFFCPLPPPVTGQAMASDIAHKAIKPAYTINTNLRRKFAGTLLVLLKTFWRLVFHKIDTVYFTCTRSKAGAIKDVWLLALCKIKKIRVVNHVHGNDLPNLFTGVFFSSIIKWAYRQIDTTVFLTQYQKKLMPDYFSAMRKIVIANCYDPELEDARTNEKDLSGLSLLYLSNLMSSKGIFVLMEAVAEILEENPKVVLRIAGRPTGDYLMSAKKVDREFKKQLACLENKYSGQIIYNGGVYGREKLRLLSRSHILVIPTFYKTESLPIVILEAMRTGNALVTTALPFMSEIVGPRQGILVEPENPDNLRQGIRALISDKKRLRQIQKNNVEHAKKRYAPQKYVEKLKAVIYQST